MRPILVLAAVSLLTACTSRLQRNVEGLAADGQYVAATEVALDAVARDAGGADALLAQAATRAWRAELDRARMFEADDQLEDALTAYDSLLTLEARVLDAGGPGLEGRDQVVAERADVARQTAILRFARAQVAYDEGRFQDALDGFRAAEALDAEATRADARIPQALSALGDAAREAHRYREAIALYDEAAREGGGERPRIWSAAIHAALGRHALREGACRQAVEELRQAAALPFDVDLADDFREARDCAQRQLVVHPFEDLVEGEIDQANLRVLLVDQINHHLRTHGSRYLMLLDPGASLLDTPPDKARRFAVEGHLTRVQVASTEGEGEPAQAPGQIRVPCDPGGPPECLEEVRVSFTHAVDTLQVDIAGAIKVVDTVTGEQVATRPLDIRVEKRRHRISDAKAVDLRDFRLKTPIGIEATERQVGVTGEARAWFAPQTELPDPDRLVDEAVVRLAATAGEAVLQAVDAPVAVEDPPQLTLVTPVTRADEIRFGDALIEEHQTEPESPLHIELQGDPVEADEAPSAPDGGTD